MNLAEAGMPRIVTAVSWWQRDGGQAAHAEPLRISYFIWIGYGPLFVAQEKGFFAEEGVEVELVNIEVHAAAFGSLFTGQVDAVAGAMPDAPAFAEPDEGPLVCVLALDDYRGGTGIVATKDIRTMADLKGKSVAVLRGSISEFYLEVLLKGAGLSQADIDVVDLSTEDSGQAFLLREVEAAVISEPFLTQAKSAEHGHVLTDTTEQPGLLVDCLMTRQTCSTTARRSSALSPAPGMRRFAISRLIPMRPTGSWPAIWAAGSRMRRSLREMLNDVGLYDADEKSRILRHARPTRADLRDHAAGDRRLVGRRDAENAGFARRRDQARHLGRVARRARGRKEPSNQSCVVSFVAVARGRLRRRPRLSRCGSAI